MQTEDESVMVGNSGGDKKHFEGADEGFDPSSAMPSWRAWICAHGSRGLHS
jgi:hypothetical protein